MGTEGVKRTNLGRDVKWTQCEQPDRDRVPSPSMAVPPKQEQDGESPETGAVPGSLPDEFL